MMVDYTNLLRIEYTILGTILYEPDHVGEVVAKLSPENFSSEGTRGLFKAISALHFDGAPVDPVTTLQKAGQEYEVVIKEVLKCYTAVSDLPYYCDSRGPDGGAACCRREGNPVDNIQLGASYRFVPSAFVGEKSGTLPGKKELPRSVTGRICYINQAHRFFRWPMRSMGIT